MIDRSSSRRTAICLWRLALGPGVPLRSLYRLPHAARRRGHIDAVDAKWTQRVNDRIDDDGWSTDSTGFADAFHADRIGLASNLLDLRMTLCLAGRADLSQRR